MLEKLGSKLYTKLPMAMGFPEEFLHSFRLVVIPNWARFGPDLVIGVLGKALFLKVRDFWRVGLKPL